MLMIFNRFGSVFTTYEVGNDVQLHNTSTISQASHHAEKLPLREGIKYQELTLD
jgi:hypothetical protein